MTKIKTVLIGHGHLGKWHAEKVQQSELAELVGIVEFNESAHSEIKQKFPQAKIAKELSQLDIEFHAAIVATPTIFHFEITKSLLESGKHVFCEKPVCHHLEAAMDLKSTSLKHKNLILQIGHSERVHACWENKKISKFLKEASFIEIDRVAPFKGRATDVSVVQDLMIHDIDLLLFQCGFDVQEVKAIGIKTLSDKYDCVTAMFEGQNNRLAKITSSRIDPVEKRMLRASHASGVIAIDLFKKEISSFENGKLIEVESYPSRDHLAIEQEHFYRSINDIKANPIFCDLNDALKVQEVMEEVEEILFAHQEDYQERV